MTLPPVPLTAFQHLCPYMLFSVTREEHCGLLAKINLFTCECNPIPSTHSRPCLQLIPPFLYSIINFPISTGSCNSEPFQSSHKHTRISLNKKNFLFTSLPLQLFVSSLCQGLSILPVFLFSISSWIHFNQAFSLTTPLWTDLLQLTWDLRIFK